MTWYGKKRVLIPTVLLSASLLAGCGPQTAEDETAATNKLAAAAAPIDAQKKADEEAAAKAAAEQAAKAAAEQAAATKAAADKAAAELAAAQAAAAEAARAEAERVAASNAAAAAEAARQAAAPAAVYYKNCDAVRAAGASPIRRGDPGYAKHLDRDGDGQGCGAD